jgi:hypothetical protein
MLPISFTDLGNEAEDDAEDDAKGVDNGKVDSRVMP